MDNSNNPSANNPSIPPTQKTDQEILNVTAEQKILATISTNQGDIQVELFHQETPKTVANFVGLSEGTKPWLNPETKQWSNTPLYQNVIFHRVIDGFMIQGGDPLGLGTGGPGYNFEDEIVPDLTFDGAGILAMANAGPGTNGSQFFITLAPTPHLNGKHTIFGKVVSGMEVVEAIGATPTGASDKPVQDVVIKSISIIRQ